MANVLFVAVREDVERAETLADMFETAGVTIISPCDEEKLLACDAAVIVWSRAATRCGAFLTAAQGAIEAGKAVVASLVEPAPSLVAAAPTFDLSHWKGERDAAVLDDFFYAAYGKAVGARRAAVAETLSARADNETDSDAAPSLMAESDAESELSPPEADAFEPANDNPEVYWASDDADDPCAFAKVGAAWTAELSDKPLPVPQTRHASRRPQKRRSKRAHVWGLRLFQAAGVALLLSAAVYSEANQPGAAPAQVAVQSGFSQIAVTDYSAPIVPELTDASAEPPHWALEPASAPRS